MEFDTEKISMDTCKEDTHDTEKICLDSGKDDTHGPKNSMDNGKDDTHSMDNCMDDTHAINHERISMDSGYDRWIPKHFNAVHVAPVATSLGVAPLHPHDVKCMLKEIALSGSACASVAKGHVGRGQTQIEES